MAIGLAADFTRDVGCIGAKLWTEWLTRDHRPQEPLRAITRTLSNIDEPVMRPTDVKYHSGRGRSPSSRMICHPRCSTKRVKRSTGQPEHQPMFLVALITFLSTPTIDRTRTHGPMASTYPGEIQKNREAGLIQPPDEGCTSF